MTETSPLVNLAARRLGASVMAASDEFFGEKENLLRPEPPSHQPRTFGLKGQLVDGWETRRHGPGEDDALIRLGAAGVIGRVVVDTAHFTGNFPAACSVQACAAEGYPSPAELAAADWVEIVPHSPLAGDCENVFAVTDPHRFTHLRLTIYPDGGVARLRAEGQVVPDPRQLAGLPLDLVALANGGTVLAASDRFYSPPENMISPGRATAGRPGAAATTATTGYCSSWPRLGISGRRSSTPPASSATPPLPPRCAAATPPGPAWTRQAGPTCCQRRRCSPTPSTCSGLARQAR